MGKLQRPATLKEFVIQSLLGWRDTAATLVDHDDEAPTLLRGTVATDPPAARDTLTSYVFDLRVVPRVASIPADDEIERDTLPSPPPIAMAIPSPVAMVLPSPPARVARRAHAHKPSPPPARLQAAPAATSATGATLVRFILFALVVLALLASARS
jgi:hypothetical protein